MTSYNIEHDTILNDNHLILIVWKVRLELYFNFYPIL